MGAQGDLFIEKGVAKFHDPFWNYFEKNFFCYQRLGRTKITELGISREGEATNMLSSKGKAFKILIE